MKADKIYPVFLNFYVVTIGQLANFNEQYGANAMKNFFNKSKLLAIRKSCIAAALLLITHTVQAAWTQSMIEAEQVSGGTVVADLGAGGGSAVTRADSGVYTWWASTTASLTTGNYSLYARIALADGVTTSKNFGAYVSYGGQNIVQQDVSINHRGFKWVRITSFDLAQIGGELLISDWSEAGLKVDKLAIIKNVTAEAEAASGLTVVADPQASGGQATTSSTGGAHVWWLPVQADLAPGDYDVYVRARSVDNAAHTYNGYVVLDDVAEPVVGVPISSIAYQWIKLNQFTNAGGTQVVRISDYSDPGLNVDAVRLVRRTPADRHSAAQSLFAAGANALGPYEEVVFQGVPQNGYNKLMDPGRVSIVRASSTVTYAYFRQDVLPNPNLHPIFQIYMGTSMDGGHTFTVNPVPIVALGDSTTLGKYIHNAYDPQVTKRDDGYYMVFEAGVRDVPCGVSSAAAYSLDGVNNWQVRNIAICGPQDTNLGSASTPTLVTDPEGGPDYIHWASVNPALQITSHYQRQLAAGTGILQTQHAYSSYSAMANYKLAQSPAGQWDAQNFGSGGVYNEDGYYYLSYEGATNYGCNGQWGLGTARTSNIIDIVNWKKSIKNPYLMATKTDSCWMQYSSIVALDQGTYLYYYHNEINYTPEGSRSIYRRLIMPN